MTIKKGLIYGLIYLQSTTGNRLSFYEEVQKNLACQFICDLVPECKLSEGSFCDQNVCFGLRTSEYDQHYCYGGSSGESLTCQSAWNIFASEIKDFMNAGSSNYTQT